MTRKNPCEMIDSQGFLLYNGYSNFSRYRLHTAKFLAGSLKQHESVSELYL